ncbi:MAG: LysR family transcriptional regulator [Pseudomonadales bacterium]|nr:LysR family transcriptional regulator [Pseudomonadales bacterium]MBO6565301.1 LysR family transcriptional regulator [Pseudomonadales bacterium]MBO6595033.1 LysR family transcriptional regulator [Pseudomonadales bacterium]MBO6821408.1 LysR family transcriptional regulator [Pseudomonadales bacterium]
MDIDSLKAFLAVAEVGSFSQAADRMHLTQPAVSKRIAQIEQQLDARLFDRIGRTVTLTEAGHSLVARANIILQQVEDAERAIRNLSGQVSGQLSLATSHHVGLWRLPRVLNNYVTKHPDVTLDLHFMDSEVAHERIVQGELEMAIITLAPVSHERLIAEPIWRDELVFVCSRSHELASRKNLGLSMLAEYAAILPDMTTFTGRIVKGMFEEHDLHLEIGMSTNYLETIKMLIGVGLGWSVLPTTMIDDDVAVLDIEIDTARTLGVIHHVNRTLSNAGEAFIDLLRGDSDYQR